MTRHTHLRSLLFSLFFFLSCQTTPRISRELPQDSFPLNSGASIYMSVDVKQAFSIIELLPMNELNERYTRLMLEKTEFAYAAFFPQESGVRFQIAARGNYPSFRAGLGFGFNKQWKKQRSTEGSYWHSAANGLSVRLNSKEAFIASSVNERPANPVVTFSAQIPEGFSGFFGSGEYSPLACWLENPDTAINRILNNAGIPLRSPVQQLFIKFFPLEENQCEAVIRLQFENTSYARAMAAIISMGAGFLQNEQDSILSAFFFANPPVLNGRNLDIKTAALGKSEMALLFQMLK